MPPQVSADRGLVGGQAAERLVLRDHHGGLIIVDRFVVTADDVRFDLTRAVGDLPREAPTVLTLRCDGDPITLTVWPLPTATVQSGPWVLDYLGGTGGRVWQRTHWRLHPRPLGDWVTRAEPDGAWLSVDLAELADASARAFPLPWSAAGDSEPGRHEESAAVHPALVPTTARLVWSPDLVVLCRDMRRWPSTLGLTVEFSVSPAGQALWRDLVLGEGAWAMTLRVACGKDVVDTVVSSDHRAKTDADAGALSVSVDQQGWDEWGGRLDVRIGPPAPAAVSLAIDWPEADVHSEPLLLSAQMLTPVGPAGRLFDLRA